MRKNSIKWKKEKTEKEIMKQIHVKKQKRKREGKKEKERKREGTKERESDGWNLLKSLWEKK